MPDQDSGKLSRILCGILLSFGGITVLLLLVLLVAHWWLPLVASPHPPARHVAVELMGGEEYHVTFESSTRINLLHEKNTLNKTVGLSSSFRVRQLAKDELASQFRFQLTNLSLKQTGRIASVTDAALEKLLTRVDHTTMYEQDFPAYLCQVLEGHSFLARLGHHGDLLERYPTNVQTTMTRAADSFVQDVLKQDPQLDRARAASLQRELRADLLEIGEEVVEEVQESIYPYLQASPASIIAVGGTWSRSSAKGWLPMTIEYKLDQLYTGKYRPVVFGVQGVSYAPEVSQSDSHDKVWLVVSVSSYQDISFPLPHSPQAAPPTPNPSNSTLEVLEPMPTRELLIVEYLDAMIPPQIRHERLFSTAKINIQLQGTLIIGATTGVVLDGWSLLTTHADITLADQDRFEVSTSGTERVRGRVLKKG